MADGRGAQRRLVGAGGRSLASVAGRSRGPLAAAAVLLAVAVLACAFVTFAAPAGATQYHLYFGDLHNHTGDSDGQGTPAQAFAAAKVAGADFLAVTDHTGWFGPATWAAQQATAASATTADFAALNGYEVTMGWGHINVYRAAVMPTDAELAAMDAGTPTSLYDWLLMSPGGIAEWNHPTWKNNDFADFAGITPERRGVMGAIETMNSGYQYEASYTKALDSGWMVMPTANSDTHQPNWISGWRQRTVLLAEDLTPAALLGALQARRGYATAVSDLRVSFRGNGEMMGSTLPQPQTITFTVRVTDPKPRRGAQQLRWVALVSDGGRVVAKKRCKGYSVDWRPTVKVATAVPGGAHYFFLRVTNVSGRAAWTAPIWTGRP